MQTPDENYLLMKVVTIFGLAGACRGAEPRELTIDNIEEKENIIIV